MHAKIKNNFLLAAGIIRGWVWLLMAHAQRPNGTIPILISFDKAQDEAATLFKKYAKQSQLLRKLFYDK